MALIDVPIECHMCGGTLTLSLDEEKFLLWKTARANRTPGVHIQDVFPELDDGQRELLICHTCSKCFDDLFAE